MSNNNSMANRNWFLPKKNDQNFLKTGKNCKFYQKIAKLCYI